MPAAASENTQSRPLGRSFREPQMQREAQGHRQAPGEPEGAKAKLRRRAARPESKAEPGTRWTPAGSADRKAQADQPERCGAALGTARWKERLP